MSTFKQSIGKYLDGNFCNTLLKCVYILQEEIFCLIVYCICDISIAYVIYLLYL